MIPLSGIPFLRFTIASISGILIYIFIQPATDFLYFYIGSLALYLLFFFLGRYRKKYYYYLRPFIGSTALCSLCFLGLLLCQLKDEQNNSYHLLNIHSKIIASQYVVSSLPEEKEKTFRIEAEAEKVFTTDKVVPASGRVILYISKEKFQNLKYGDVILVKGKPELVEVPKNPYEFNYKQYLHFKHIYHTQFVKSGDYKITAHNKGNPVIAFAFHLRSKADNVVREYVPGKTEQAIASALLLGIRGTLDDETKNVFSTTGTTHVLAVSGLHVAIVFQILVVMFYFLKSSKFQRFILPIILTSALWIYVLVTGFCPSVLRAGVMLSLVIIGKALNKNINIYNSIFCSAFFLLLIDPFMIMDTGFQLSYLALIGIVNFADKIYHLKEFNNLFVDKIWLAISVSLAAQITTLPISLLYFHQFPVLFLLSNLIAIPLSTLILYSGASLLMTSFIPGLAIWIGLFTGKLITLMNLILTFIYKIPFVSIASINIEPLQAILIYLFILSITVFLNRRRFKYFIAAFTLASIFLISVLIHSFQIKTQKKFIAFSIKGHKAIAFLKGNNAYLITDSNLANQEEKISRYILPCFIKYGIKNYEINKKPDWISHHQGKGYEIITFNKKSFLLLNEKISEVTLPSFSYLITDDYYDSLENAEADLIVINNSKKKYQQLSDRIYNLSQEALEINL